MAEEAAAAAAAEAGGVSSLLLLRDERVFRGVVTVVCVYLVLRLARGLRDLLCSEKWTGFRVKDVDIALNGVQYPCSYWAEKGLRPHMEDRFDAQHGPFDDDCSCYGVYDGHGGFRCAEYCAKHLLTKAIREPRFAHAPADALRAAYHEVESEFLDIAAEKGYRGGTTAVTLVIRNGKMYIANTGDSRAILVRKGGRAEPLSVDHKPSRPDERERIRQLGGKIILFRVQGVLAMSRAIGDATLKPYVSCDPEIVEREIGEDDWYVVLASDGLWDVLSNDQVAEFVLGCDSFQMCAKKLCRYALLCGSSDNVTALVIDLRQMYSPNGGDSPAAANADRDEGRGEHKSGRGDGDGDSGEADTHTAAQPAASRHNAATDSASFASSSTAAAITEPPPSASTASTASTPSLHSQDILEGSGQRHRSTDANGRVAR